MDGEWAADNQGILWHTVLMCNCGNLVSVRICPEDTVITIIRSM
jgi:hypothetical protein